MTILSTATLIWFRILIWFEDVKRSVLSKISTESWWTLKSADIAEEINSHSKAWGFLMEFLLSSFVGSDWVSLPCEGKSTKSHHSIWSTAWQFRRMFVELIWANTIWMRLHCGSETLQLNILFYISLVVNSVSGKQRYFTQMESTDLSYTYTLIWLPKKKEKKLWWKHNNNTKRKVPKTE